eukprot:gb/GEZN01004306.1/.p1 GENE.gb/GEZN01004306.1/~~gb/GEZN01004306.1/.p1  ORF type:complete len:599 (+),score=68.57 gb/GEZN01004306.1/:76-1872(+)
MLWVQLIGLSSLAVAQYPASVEILKFDGLMPRLPRVMNDPVMGGLSTSKFEPSTGVWSGTVQIVPSLGGPGFCLLQTFLVPPADVTAFTHLVIRMKSHIPYIGFKACFSRSPAAGDDMNMAMLNCHKANFYILGDGVARDVVLPWALFSDDWNPATGEPTKSCTRNSKEVCLTKESLADLYEFSLWAEGTAGPFNSTLISVKAAVVADPTKTIIENALMIPGLSTMTRIFSLPPFATELGLLNKEGSFTVFVPTDEAFNAAGVDVAFALANVGLIRDLMLYHMMPGFANTVDMLSRTTFGTTLRFKGKNAQVLGVKVDFGGVGGVTTNFGIPSSAGPDTARVVGADYVCSNGVLHVVDRVFHVPDDVVTTATASKVLGRLLRYLERTGLLATILGLERVTIFAPMDSAFDAIDADSLSDQDLTTMLLNHVVVDTTAYSPFIAAGDRLATLANETLTVVLPPLPSPAPASSSRFGVPPPAPKQKVMIAGARNSVEVMLPDVLVSNGVVHLIDQVLIPSTLKAFDLSKDDQVKADLPPEQPAAKQKGVSGGLLALVVVCSIFGGMILGYGLSSYCRKDSRAVAPSDFESGTKLDNEMAVG